MVVVPGPRARLPRCSRRVAVARAARPPRRSPGVVLVAVSGAWIAAVDLTPRADRPYVGSTTNNSALSLALDYNGLGRVTGQTGGTSTGGGLRRRVLRARPACFRLLNNALGDQGGWLLPLAIVGGALARSSPRRVARRRRELGALDRRSAAGSSPAAVVFSFSSGIIHTYYLSALAPATSALVGVGRGRALARRAARRLLARAAARRARALRAGSRSRSCAARATCRGCRRS